jgi:N-acetylmuramoyl-L-alanine amidase
MRRRLCCFTSGLTMLCLVVSTFALSSPEDLKAHRGRSSAARPTPIPSSDPLAEGSSREVKAQSSRPSTVIVIDAGHGGVDRGGIPGQRIAEKTMTLDVAQRLQAVLVATGYRVVMTRDSDVFVPLPTRVAIANSHGNAIFVCIHFNSATRRGANGIETYFYSRDSLALASAIHYYVAGGAPTLNRGVRRRGYYVLRRTRIPAVLVECGFLTNPTEAQYAQSVSYRQKLAEEIALGIRGRGGVASSAGSNLLAVNSATVPLQPFIDQTRVRDPDLSRSKHSTKRSSKSKSSKSRKKSSVASHDSDTEETKPSRKKSLKKHTQSSDDESGSNTKKKPSPKTTED